MTRPASDDVRNVTPSVIIYGGGFDPPHSGHVDCVSLALRNYPDARVHIVPTFAPSVPKHPVATFDQRIAMARLAFDMPGVSVETWERELPSPSYTSRTLAHVAQLYPRSKVGFLLGQDQLAAFHEWHEPDVILRHARLIVVARRDNGEAAPRAALRADVTAMAARIGLAADACDRSVLPLRGTISEAASHEIRERLAAGTAVPQGWLAPAVADYIKDNQLYRLSISTV